MITLIHGSDTEKSRDELNRQRGLAKNTEIRTIDGKSVRPEDLVQALESDSLFGGNLTVIAENLLSSLGRKIKQAESIISIINTASHAGTQILIWEGKEIAKGLIGKLDKPVLSIHNHPVLIFQFLDNVKPGNFPALSSMYAALLRNEAPELIHSMLIRRLRQLIMVKGSVTPEGLQPWQTSRLTSQASSFSMEQLVGLYKRLIGIEYAIKSGGSAFDFSKNLELFLIEV
jgi:DNA polymerase III delta subunit